MIQIIDLPSDNATAIEQAAHILNTAFREYFPGSWASMEDARAEMRDLLTLEHICLVALDDEANNVVVGLIAGNAQYNGHVWELHPLAVHPDRHKRGIGRVLVQAFETQVKTRGGLTIILGSDDEHDMTSLSGVDLYQDLWDKVRTIQNRKGHPYGFYQKMGYTIIGVVPDANGRGKPDIIMGKRILD